MAVIADSHLGLTCFENNKSGVFYCHGKYQFAGVINLFLMISY